MNRVNDSMILTNIYYHLNKDISSTIIHPFNYLKGKLIDGFKK